MSLHRRGFRLAGLTLQDCTAQHEFESSQADYAATAVARHSRPAALRRSILPTLECVGCTDGVEIGDVSSKL